MQRQTTTAAQRTGDAAEDVVARRLTLAGWAVLGRNVRVGRSELDIVAVDSTAGEVVIVEVRWRSRRDYGLAEETLDARKRRALRRAVGGLLERGALADGTPLPRLPLRVDLVAVDRSPDGSVAIRHHRSIRL